MTHSLERVQEMDEKMQQLKEGKIFLENFLQEFQKTSENKKTLLAYYEQKWIQDFDAYPEESYEILSEDGLYNLIFDIEELQKQIAKLVVSEL